MPVLAAGALLWRKEKGELKVLMIHRTRYDDWSWPKGKLDKGENITQTAVREIKEETGLKVSLGVKLFVSEYRLDNGNKKVVHYWAAQVTDQALKRQKFTPDDEVGSFEWLSVKEAKKRMTYKHDNEPLKALVALDEADELDTRSVIVLRHAKATPRDQWTKGEASRPLLKEGAVQAVALTKVLAAFGPKLVVTSSWRRCLDTVLPFVSKHKVRLLKRSQLSELGAKNGPQRTEKLISGLVNSGKPLVICSHRPALPAIVSALEKYADKQTRKALPEITSLKPGSFYVLQVTNNRKQKIVSMDLVEPLEQD